MSGKDKKKDKKDKGKDKKKDKAGKGTAPAAGVGHGAAAAPAQPHAYHSQRVRYNYASPVQNPALPFEPPVNLDETTRALFITSALAFKSVDLDGNGSLSSGEFKTAMKKLNYIVPKQDVPAAASGGKKDKKDKKNKAQKKNAKGAWKELFDVIDSDHGGTIDIREFCEYYVWAQNQGLGRATGAVAHSQPGSHSTSHMSAYIGMGAPTVGFNWQKVDGSLTKISVSGQNVWGVNAAGDIWKFNQGAWVQAPGKASDIGCSSDGTVWCVTPTDEIYRMNAGGSWEQVPGNLVGLSVASANNVWGVNRASEIYNWNGAAWTQVEGSASTLSAGEDGTVWAINGANVYRRPGVTGAWEQIPGTLTAVSVFNANSVVGCNAAGEIWVWTGQGWTQAPGGSKEVSVGGNLNSHVWVATATGEIYRHQG